MNLKSGTMLKALLARFHSHESDYLLTYLSESEKNTLEKIATPASHSLPSDWFLGIHYSWFFAPLAKLPPQIKVSFLGLFEPESAKKLADMLEIKEPHTPLTPVLGPFLLEFLKKELIPANILPLEFLPPSPLNDLLTLTKSQLIHMIDLLGIHDLAADLKQVVDRTLLNKVHEALSSEQKSFLAFASKQQTKWVPMKLPLEKWTGDKKTLNNLLHKKGLFRLGMSLVFEDPSLQWHLCHRLDSGRGEALMKLFVGKEDPAIIAYFKAEVLDLLQRYNR